MYIVVAVYINNVYQMYINVYQCMSMCVNVCQLRYQFGCVMAGLEPILGKLGQIGQGNMTIFIQIGGSIHEAHIATGMRHLQNLQQVQDPPS